MIEGHVQSNRDLCRDFDISSPDFANNYEDVLSELHGRCPVAHSNEQGGYWVVSRADDVKSIALDWQTWTSTQGYEPNRVGDDNFRLYPLELDPPYQTKWRAKLGDFFTPRAMRSREDSIREHANAVIDTFIEKGECEFVDAFAAQLPPRVFFSNLLQVPISELDYIVQSADDAVRGPFEGRQEGWNKIGQFLDDYMRGREHGEPAGDFVDAILEGVETDDGEPAPWKHKIFVMLDMIAGGLTTTTTLLAGVAHFLATHPEDRERLLADPTLRKGAVEELTRFYAPITAVGRTATRDTEVSGQTIKKGDMVMVGFGLAGRDPSAYENPHQIDIEREITVNTTFGYGPHRCIGMHLAKLEALVTLEELLRRLPDLRIADDSNISYDHRGTVSRDMIQLPLLFTPGSKRQTG